MEKKFSEMTLDEKQEVYFNNVLSPKDPQGNPIKFNSPEAEAKYKANVTRLKDAIQMKKTPDRVPIALLPSMYAFNHGGITPYTAMYDYDKCASSFKNFITEFDPDMHIGAAQAGSGKFLELVDYKLYAWPGHGVAKEHCYQALEGEYMKPEEYDILISDPTYFFTNFYLPRVFGVLGGFQMLPYFPTIQEIYGVAGAFIPFGLPPVQETYKKLAEAGAEALKWAMTMGALNLELTSLGYANILAAGNSKAPFDTIGDTLRGTRGIMMDMYRRPDVLLKALDAMVPVMIKMGLDAVKMTGNPVVFMPLHKAADGFLSDAQFKKFYWPTFKQVLLGLIDAGAIPFPALEGSWTSRLEIIQDIPKGKTVWMVDQSDIVKAKKTLGKKACLLGNVPSSLLKLGTIQEMKDYCKKLIDTAGKDGGFIMANGAFFDEAKPENVKAMVDFTKEYGVYK